MHKICVPFHKLCIWLQDFGDAAKIMMYPAAVTKFELAMDSALLVSVYIHMQYNICETVYVFETSA